MNNKDKKVINIEYIAGMSKDERVIAVDMLMRLADNNGLGNNYRGHKYSLCVKLCRLIFCLYSDNINNTEGDAYRLMKNHNLSNLRLFEFYKTLYKVIEEGYQVSDYEKEILKNILIK